MVKVNSESVIETVENKTAVRKGCMTKVLEMWPEKLTNTTVG